MAVSGRKNPRRPAAPAGGAPSQVRVRVTTAGGPSSLSAARRSGFIEALATVLRIEPRAIHEHGVYAGDLPDQDQMPEPDRRRPMLLRGLRRGASVAGERATVFDLSLPPEALERFRALVKNNSAQLALLRVRGIAIAREAGEAEEWALSAGRFVPVSSPPALHPHAEPQKVSLFSPLVVGVMTGCIAWSFVAFIHVIVPAWNGAYLLAGCVLAAIEAGYSHQLLRTRRRFYDELVRFRAVELALLFVLIKAGGYLGEDWSAIVADIKSWPHNPLTILNLETLVAYLAAVLSWLGADSTARDLDRLREPPLRSRYYLSPLDSLTNRFFGGGVLMLVISGMALVGDAVVASSDPAVRALLQAVPGSSAPGLGSATLVYFCLGLVMLGQVRIALYGQSWQEQGIPVDRGLPGRWTRISLVFVALAALLAFVLPTNYRAVGWLLQVAGTAIAWLMAVIAYLGGLIIFAFLSALGLMASLVLRDGTAEPRPAARPEFTPPVVPPSAPGVTPDWVLMMRSILFWGLILVSLVYVIRAYLREHPELVTWVGQVRPVRALCRLWQLFRGWLARWRGQVRLRLPRRAARLPSAVKLAGSPLRFLRLGALSSRERILYYYWSVLRRAQRLGLPRRPPETPSEYRGSLSPHIPQAEQELGRLTDAFLEARYSGRHMERGEDRTVRTDWQSVKTALRALRKKEAADRKSDADSS